MMKKKSKLELTWPGKNETVPLKPFRIIETPGLSYASEQEAKVNTSFDNLLIQGDNLPALKALEENFSERIKCVYIDPPYNTGAEFEHYDDNLEHSTWLSLMRTRLMSLRRLLRKDGFLCCHIDDSEGPYLKVLLDEVFGRSNYLATFYIRVRYSQKALKQDMDFHREIECIHVYRKSPAAKPNKEYVSTSYDKFCHYIEALAPPRKILELGGKQVEIFSKDSYRISKRHGSGDGLKEIWASGIILDGNSSGRFFRDHLAGREQEDGLNTLYRVTGIGDDRLPYRYFTGPKRKGATKGKYFQGIPNGVDLAKSVAQPILGFYDFAGSFGNCRHEGGVEFRSGKKPEALLELILRYFSSSGDWVLDAFAGSGTTGAVAHKMGRSWIMIEYADHFEDRVLARLRAVVGGSDRAGVSERLGWLGGGGFKVFRVVADRVQEGSSIEEQGLQTVL